MPKIITTTIGNDGTVKVETTGFVGTDCLQETLALEEALGAKTADVKKPEFYATQQQHQQQKARG